MPLIYRKGRPTGAANNLTPNEVDDNFSHLEAAVAAVATVASSADRLANAVTISQPHAGIKVRVIDADGREGLIDLSLLLSTTTPLPASISATGPVSGTAGMVSSPFTVAYQGVSLTAITITPTASDGGTFSPTSVTLAAGENVQATFTYTPASSGNKLITFANGAAWLNALRPYLVSKAARLAYVSYFNEKVESWTGPLAKVELSADRPLIRQAMRDLHNALRAVQAS